MRVRLIFNVKNPGAIIPFHHQPILSELFKTLLQREPKLAEFNLYNFSSIKGKFVTGKEGLRLVSSRATIVFSSPTEEELHLFIQVLLKEKIISLGQAILESIGGEKEKDILINQHAVKYLCLSPLIIVHPKDSSNDPKNFFNPAMDQFSDLLYESTINRLESSGRFSPEELSGFNKFQFIPDHSFLNKIKNSDKKFSRIYPVTLESQKYEVRGYTLPFTLYASTPIHNFIFQSGIGELTENGLGMLDLADMIYKQRLSPLN